MENREDGGGFGGGPRAHSAAIAREFTRGFERLGLIWRRMLGRTNTVENRANFSPNRYTLFCIKPPIGYNSQFFAFSTLFLCASLSFQTRDRFEGNEELKLSLLKSF